MKLSAKLPQPDDNGLISIAQDMVIDPSGVHLVICQMTCGAVSFEDDGSLLVPTARIVATEIVREVDRPLVEAAMAAARTARIEKIITETGQPPLPIDDYI